MDRIKNKKLKIFSSIIVSTLLLLSFFIKRKTLFSIYEQNIFLPYQQFRASLLSNIPFSIGDIIYILFFIALLFFIGYSIYFIKKCLKNKSGWANFLFPSIISILSVYLLYFYSWGANYNRQAIWSPTETNSWNQKELVSLNEFLVDKMNEINEPVTQYNLKTINKELRDVYRNEFGKNVPYLEVKPSLFSNLIFNFGIQGYYNPISGEAQFAKPLPSFMWGFVIAHEMAHQTGIAAEGEANMMAYVICMKSKISHLKYSAYFNLFLYANKELSKKDSVLAIEKREMLTSNNLNNLEYLKNMRLKYKSIFRGNVLDIYDWLLKIQGQEDGLDSYNEISKLIYYWEKEGNPKINLY
ncbi:MAG TPA: DUF3810 family protein [Edaphocola sp.]|nr:DUF3810 family protein [Edaphocola sp.]